MITGDSEARYRLIADSARDVVVQMDLDAQVVYASPSVRMMGYRPDELVGRPGPSFVHPDDLQRLLDNTAYVLRGGEADDSQDRRYRFKRKGGGYRWFEGNPSRLLDETGAVVGYLNILRDVHDSVLAAEALAQSEALYRLLADNMSDLIIRYDAKGILRYVSPSIRQFGYAPADLLGRNVSEFVVQEDVPVPLRARLESDEPLRSGPENAFRVRHQDGRLIWCQGNPSVIRDADGAPIGIVTVVHDITDRRALEEELRRKKDEAERSAARLKLAVEAGRLAVWQVDQVTGVVHGPEFNAILGYPPEHNLTADEVRSRYLPGELERLRAVTSAAYARGDRNVEVAARFRRLDGKLRWLLIRGEPALNPEGELRASVGVAMDITDRKDAEESLAASEALYRLLADNMSDLVVRLDRDGRFSYASPSWRTLGYAPEEIVGRLGEDFVHPDDVPKVRDCVADILAGGPGASDRRYRLRAKDGSYRLHEGSPSPATDEAGRIVGVINVLRDVTEQVAASDALAASEARYRLLAEHMSDVVVKLDVEGRIQYVSPSVRAMGYEPDELLGRDRSEFIHADEVPRLLDNMAHLRSGVLDRRRDRTHRIRLKDGGYRWFDGLPSPITDENGVVVGVINVLRDIHEIKVAEEVLAASEARYRLLADNMGDIIVCYGRDGVVTFISGATKATLGYEPAELLGRRIGAMIHPDDLERVGALFEQNFQVGPGAAHFSFEYRMFRKDGSVVWLEAHPRGHYGADGAFVEWQDVVRDITGHKVLEEELRAARRTADAATKTKAAFLADMSHELRGPLSSIASFSRLAGERPAVPASVRTALERIEIASVDLIGMVNDILDFSRLEAAEVVFRMRPVSVSELARASVGLLEPQAHAKGLELRIVDRTPAGLVVSLDQGRVRQVLLNLLGNAVKFTHSGRVTLEVRHDPDKGRLSVNVRDTGPGIPADSLGLLFDRFTQVSDDGPDAYGGAGLGLAISKAIVEGLGGKISVETKLGRGSCFSFWIPAAPTAEAFDHEEPKPRLRVVVVHADEGIGEIVARALAPLNVEVLTVADGDAALKLATRGGVDVILADLQLARTSGATLMGLGRRRGRHARVPILALSPVADDTLYAKVLEEGFRGLVTTPFTPSDLTSAIAHAFAFDPALA